MACRVPDRDRCDPAPLPCLWQEHLLSPPLFSPGTVCQDRASPTLFSTGSLCTSYLHQLVFKFSTMIRKPTLRSLQHGAAGGGAVLCSPARSSMPRMGIWGCTCFVTVSQVAACQHRDAFVCTHTRVCQPGPHGMRLGARVAEGASLAHVLVCTMVHCFGCKLMFLMLLNEQAFSSEVLIARMCAIQPLQQCE
jgi:hypothetical protein